jgi:hypothetical protein
MMYPLRAAVRRRPGASPPSEVAAKPITTMSRLRRAFTLAAATAVIAIAGTLPATVSVVHAAPAGAATAVDCSDGVIVAVDFGYWEGDTDAVCDTILPANAAYALVATGFDPTPVSSYGLDFICQIAAPDGVEYPESENCTTTPPADAYWSFWYANAGQTSWTYSNVGAMSLQPQAGSIEAWVFGGENGGSQPPGLPTPQQIQMATTQTVTGTGTGTGTTTTTTTSSGAPSGSSGSNPAPAPQGATTDPATASTPSAAAGTTSTTAPTLTKLSPSPGQAASTTGHASPSAHETPASGATSTSRPANGERIVSAVPAVAARHSSSGPSTSFIVGAGVIVLLIAVAGTLTWARRRERPEGM